MPTALLKHREERRALGRLFIELTRMYRQAFKDMGKDDPIDCSLMLVSAAVIVGHAENKPMTASKIAHYIDVPRTTVLRKLDELVALGAIERRSNTYVMTQVRASNATVTVARFVRVFEAAHKAMKDSPMRHM